MHKMKYLWKSWRFCKKMVFREAMRPTCTHKHRHTHAHLHTHSHPHTHTDTHMRTSTSPPEKLTFDLSTLLVTHTQEITSRPNERTQAQTDVSGTNWAWPVQRPTSNRSLLSTNNLGCLIRPSSSSSATERSILIWRRQPLCEKLLSWGTRLFKKEVYCNRVPKTRSEFQRTSLDMVVRAIKIHSCVL